VRVPRVLLDPPRTRLDVDERRQQLVELGLTQFGTQTYDEVSIDDIAHRAGISKGLLYHYFPTKRAFYVACVSEAAERLLARLNQVDEETKRLSPLEQLSASLDAYLAYVRAHGPAFATLMRGGASIDREIGSIVDETRSALLDLLMSGLNEIFPNTPSTITTNPLVKIALNGWVGLAEAASIEWVESSVADPKTAPSAARVRDLLAASLVAIIQNVLV
jgi:AcrR family transcriptional regulator